MADLPSGTVTMLFSDIEGSTALLARLGDRYAEALDLHRRVLRSAWATWDGVEVGTEGDSFFVAFDVASHGVAAALEAQRALSDCEWPDGGQVAVRIGVHTGEPTLHGGGYVGMDVHRAARIAASAHGGQVVLSEATSLLVSGSLGREIKLVDLGRHRLKDLSAPEHLYQLVAPGLEQAFPPLQSLGTEANLPTPSTPLVGREGELTQLLRLATSPDVRLITLTGPGGSGKTRLATAVASELAGSYSDGVYFVPLAAVTSGAAMWTTVAEAMGASGDGRAKPRFLEWLRPHQVLVVLDNVEQLPAAPAVVSELLSVAPTVEIIATSRSPLHLQGEHEYPVPPLRLPGDSGLEEARRSEAVQLFCQQAHLVRPGFTLDVDNVGDVVWVCQRLDGMPLAIELAAARVKLLSPAALVARLDRTLDLAGREVDRPARQQTLRAAIGWSYQLLSAELQAFFRRLAVFAGGADLDAVAALTTEFPDTFESVDELVDASLVDVTNGPDGEPRLQLLQTIRDFALERLKEADEHQGARQLHGVHYLGVAKTSSDQMDGDQLIDGRDRLDLEQDNMRAVLDWAMEPTRPSFSPTSQQLSVGLQLCDLLYSYWRSGHRVEARQWYERGLQLAGDHDSEELAVHLLRLGGLQFIQGEVAESVAPLARCLAIFRRLGAEAGVTAALRILGEVHGSRGEFGAARRLLGESLERARRDGDRHQVAVALTDLAWVETLAGDPLAATVHLEESLPLFRELGHTAWVAAAELQLAAARLALGDLTDASTRLEGLTNNQVLLSDSEDACLLVEQHALLAAARGDSIRAARLLGTANATRRRDDVPIARSERAYLDQHLAPARDAVSEAEWAQAYQDGSGMTLEEGLAAAWHLS